MGRRQPDSGFYKTVNTANPGLGRIGRGSRRISRAEQFTGYGIVPPAIQYHDMPIHGLSPHCTVPALLVLPLSCMFAAPVSLLSVFLRKQYT